ncbi:MAG: 1-phosphofructokinase [Anaerolineaceae bacterium]|nr:1-phosphofructokinase [Anaerolineaceae bacterium]MDD4043453.1 1-phosphofructokinase [Anaerolineaceae bacterium]MDD4578669.1 1-phosphofructokinase [Anaerolineaceae bacterium]
MIYTITLNPALDKQLTVADIRFNDVLIAEKVQLDFGGKGFNVSRMLKELNQTSKAVGLLGGHTGKTIAEGLIAQGIEVVSIPVSGETRTNVSIVTPGGSKHIKVNEKGPTVREDELQQIYQYIAEHAAVGTLWVLAGSIPPGVDCSAYRQMSQKIQELGGDVVLDTSGEALREGIKVKPKLVKPNLFELSQLTGREITDLQEVLDNPAIASSVGAEFVAISAGDKGALLTDGEKIALCLPPEIQEANPVGAGDAMVAGLSFALYHGYDLEQALMLGVACGTASALQSGTKMPAWDLVEEIRQQVRIL